MYLRPVEKCHSCKAETDLHSVALRTAPSCTRMIYSVVPSRKKPGVVNATLSGASSGNWTFTSASEARFTTWTVSLVAALMNATIAPASVLCCVTYRQKGIKDVCNSNKQNHILSLNMSFSYKKALYNISNLDKYKWWNIYMKLTWCQVDDGIKHPLNYVCLRCEHFNTSKDHLQWHHVKKKMLTKNK